MKETESRTTKPRNEVMTCVLSVLGTPGYIVVPHWVSVTERKSRSTRRTVEGRDPETGTVRETDLVNRTRR